MNTLYELDSKIAELLDTGFEMSCIDAETGEIDETQLAVYLEQLQLDRKTKIDNIAVYVKNLEAEAVAIKAEEKRLKERREAKERKAERLKNYIKTSMVLQGETKFESARVSMALRNSKAVVVDESKLESVYFINKLVQSVDKKAIKAALEAGILVEGAMLEERKNLQIK
jgi:hypothetical protein